MLTIATQWLVNGNIHFRQEHLSGFEHICILYQVPVPVSHII